MINFIIGVLVGFLATTLWHYRWAFSGASIERRVLRCDRIAREAEGVYRAAMAASDRGDMEEFRRLREKHRQLKDELLGL